jgi:hypothetical protein
MSRLLRGCRCYDKRSCGDSAYKEMDLSKSSLPTGRKCFKKKFQVGNLSASALPRSRHARRPLLTKSRGEENIMLSLRPQGKILAFLDNDGTKF